MLSKIYNDNRMFEEYQIINKFSLYFIHKNKKTRDQIVKKFDRNKVLIVSFMTVSTECFLRI